MFHNVLSLNSVSATIIHCNGNSRLFIFLVLLADRLSRHYLGSGRLSLTSLLPGKLECFADDEGVLLLADVTACNRQ